MLGVWRTIGFSKRGYSYRVARTATSWGTVDVAGEMMPRGLFNTPLVRPHGSGPRTGLRVEEGEDLPCSSHHEVLVEPYVSSGAGPAIGTASR